MVKKCLSFNQFISITVASKIKISDTPDMPKATFVRKSAFLTTGDDSFRFNFNLDRQDVDQGSDKTPTESNTEHSENGNTDKSTDVANADKSNDDANTENPQSKNSKNFKFSFTESQFKFNFNSNS